MKITSNEISKKAYGNKTLEQIYQDNEYDFPYHYVMNYFNNRFKHYFIDSWSINYASTIEFMLSKINIGYDKKIVDIGCGDGRFSRELSLSFNSSNVVGIDYSEKAITLASAMNHDISNLTFITTDITTEDNIDKFDIAILMEVLEHIQLEDTKKFIASVHKLLKCNGILYLTVPHKNKPLEYKHFQHFNINGICNLIKPYFDIVEVVPFEKNSWLRIVVQKLLSNNLFILSNASLLSLIYRFYKRNLFFCDSENNCQRIFVKATAK